MDFPIWFIIAVALVSQFAVITVLAMKVRDLQVLLMMLNGELYQANLYNAALQSVVTNEKPMPYSERQT